MRDLIRRVLWAVWRRAFATPPATVGTPSPVVAAGLREYARDLHRPTWRDPDDADAATFQRISRAARRDAARAFDLARGRPRQGVLLRRLDGVRIARACRIALDIYNEES